MSLSQCKFTNSVESKEVNIFNTLTGAEQVNIDNCIFNNSNFEIQKSQTMTSIENTFKSTNINIRYSNSMFHRNSFTGEFRIQYFNSYLNQINNNIFVDIEAYSYFIDVDHNSKLYLTNNKISTSTENFSLVKIFRYGKCYMDNNNIEIKPDQILSSVEFGGELYVSNNNFNKKDIEIAAYDCKVFIEKNNKLTDNIIQINKNSIDNEIEINKKSIDNETEINFLLTERNIIKPSNKYVSVC